MAIEFRPELFQPRGNFLNLKSEEITRIVADSDSLTPERRAHQQRLRDKYLPEIPGYVPASPINLAECNRYLNYLVELRSKAGAANLDAPYVGLLAVAREITTLNLFRGADIWNVPKSVLDIARNVTDAYSETEYARIKMMVEFNNSVSEYIKLANRMYLAEKKDTIAFLFSEMERAYVSYNRYENFFLGKGFAGVHHAVSETVARMERTWRDAEGNMKGAISRRERGVGGIFGELTIPAQKYGASGYQWLKQFFIGWQNSSPEDA